MRKRLHIPLLETRKLPPFHPRPRPDVRNAVLALAIAGEIVAWLAGVFSREVDLEDAVDAQGLVAEALDGVWKRGELVGLVIRG